MARTLFDHIDFDGKQARRAVFNPVTADPAQPFYPFEVWTRTDLNQVRMAITTTTYVTLRDSATALSNGDIANGAAIALSKLATDPLARANHTGSQLAATISDLASVVKAYRVDEFAAPTSAVAFNSQRLTAVADGVADSDAATFGQLKSLVSGLDVKNSVRAATTANITLSAPQTIDGVAVVAGDRVLVKNQTTAATNGIYVAAAGTWSRATDMDTWAEIPGSLVVVEQGTANADSVWLASSDQGGTLGTTAVTFINFPVTNTVVAGNGLTLTGQTFAVGAGTGIVVGATTVGIDTNTVGRKLVTTATGTGAVAQFTITHNLNNKAVQVAVQDNATGVIGECGTTSTLNNVTITFGFTPANGAVYNVSIIG